MARKQYAIRVSMDQNPLDMVMNPSANSMFASRYEFTIKSFLCLIIMGVLAFGLTTYTFLKQSGTLGFCIWIPAYVYLSWLLFGPTDTKEMGISYIPTFFSYFLNDSRYVSTRKVAEESGFLSIAHLRGITDTGKIIFTDNSVGYGFELVGNASILMFPEDRDRVIEDVRSFYRNINPSVHLIYDNVLSGQRVVDQLNGKDYQLEHLREGMFADSRFDPVREMTQAEQLQLRDFVGKKFKSLHQYLIVVAPNDGDLEGFCDWLKQQTISNSAYIKSYRQLSKEELIRYYKGLYSMDEE